MNHPLPKSLRRRVLERQNWRCACGQYATEVHHKRFRRYRGGDDPSNLVALCRDCHLAQHRGDKSKNAPAHLKGWARRLEALQ